MTDHLKPFAFKPGQSGDPNRQPKGSRNKLSEALLNDLCGMARAREEAIKKMAENRRFRQGRRVAHAQGNRSGKRASCRF